MPNLKSELLIKLVDNVSGPAQKVTDALKKSESQIKAVDNAFKGTGASARFQQQLASLGRSAAEVDKVSRSMREYASAANIAGNAANWSKDQAAQMKRWETQTISALKNVSAQEKAFERQQLATGAAQRRRITSPHGLRSHLADHVPGIGGAVVGGGLLHQGWEAAKSGVDIESEKQKLRAAGIPEGEIDSVLKQSADIATRVPGTKISTALEDYKHLRSSLNHPDEAPKLFEDVERAHVAMNAADPSGRMAEGMPFLLKGAEELGKTKDPAAFRQYMDQFIKGQQVMGKTITPEHQFEFAKYARAAGPQLSDRFLGTTALSLGQEMGGSSAGNAIATLQRELQAGFPGNHGAAKEFVRLGLANEDDFEKTKTGEIKGLKEGKHVAGWQMAMTDPDKWWGQYGKPALDKAGITDPQAQAAEITKMFPNRTASDLISKFNNQQGAFEQHAKLYEAAQGLGAAEGNQKDPYQAFSAFQAAITNFTGVVSGPAVSKAAEGLSSLASAISSFTPAVERWTKENPNTTAAGVGVAGAGGAYLGGRMISGGIRRALGRGAVTAVEGGGAEAAMGGLTAAIGSAGGAALVAAGAFGAVYKSLEWALGREWGDKRDKQAFGDDQNRYNKLGLNYLNPFAGFNGQIGTPGVGTLSEKPPSWSVRNDAPPAWPMVGKTGATAGVQSPDFVDAGSAGNTAAGVSGALSVPNAGGTGARVGSDYAAGLQEQLAQAIAYARQAAEEIRAALDFSVTPQINSSGGASASSPQKQSSLTHIDHGRASAANVWPLSG
jgi:hypothetical protein